MARTAKKVAETPAVAVVSETELQQIVNDRKAVKDLESTVRATKKRLDAQEASVIARLRNGAKVEGKLVCIVNMVKGRVAVSWKDVAQKLAVKAGLLFEAVEVEERNAKEASLVPEPDLVIVDNAVEQYAAK
jgi:hypothetical protein